MTQHKITILGTGSFGTAIADILNRQNQHVYLWGRDERLVDEINTRQTNEKYFPNARLSQLKATANLAEALDGSAFVVFSIPCQHLRSVLQKANGLLPPQSLVINLAKGIETESLALPSQIFVDELGKDITDRYTMLSGPTFARELYQGMPSGAVVASSSRRTARLVQKNLSTKFFRLYESSDVVGVELGGALKNVMAIGVGIADGLGFGLNTRAGLITRCLSDMMTLGNVLGANPLTFAGLSGIGDLILTCTGDLSRNRQVGLRLGRGEKLADILSHSHHVVEGVATAKSVYQLLTRLGLDMPNALHVYKILYEGMTPKSALESILARELKVEFEEE